MVMVFPVPIIGAVISPDYNRCSSIHHRRLGYDDGRWVDDDWWWGSDHDWSRGDDHRKPDTYGYPSPGMCRERQGKGYYA
jgi:hypothetical protein